MFFSTESRQCNRFHILLILFLTFLYSNFFSEVANLFDLTWPSYAIVTYIILSVRRPLWLVILQGSIIHPPRTLLHHLAGMLLLSMFSFSFVIFHNDFDEEYSRNYMYWHSQFHETWTLTLWHSVNRVSHRTSKLCCLSLNTCKFHIIRPGRHVYIVSSHFDPIPVKADNADLHSVQIIVNPLGSPNGFG